MRGDWELRPRAHACRPAARLERNMTQANTETAARGARARRRRTDAGPAAARRGGRAARRALEPQFIAPAAVCGRSSRRASGDVDAARAAIDGGARPAPVLHRGLAAARARGRRRRRRRGRGRRSALAISAKTATREAAHRARPRARATVERPSRRCPHPLARAPTRRRHGRARPGRAGTRTRPSCGRAAPRVGGRSGGPYPRRRRCWRQAEARAGAPRRDAGSGRGPRSQRLAASSAPSGSRRS